MADSQSLRIIDHIDVATLDGPRRVALYHGSVAEIPAGQNVDFLIVSAFQDSYVPTSGTVMKSLADKGLSVAALAADKQYDLRSTCGFWLSKDISQSHPDLHIRHILCFESKTIGDPPQVVGEMFRGMFPFLDMKNGSTVATSLLATGNQRWEPSQMFFPLIEAAVEWLRRGLPILELKIIIRSEELASSLSDGMKAIREQLPVSPLWKESISDFDVFISYSSVDSAGAELLKELLRRTNAAVRIFDFKTEIDVGMSYQSVIDEALERCRKIIALLSPAYFSSPECQEELHIARLRNKRAAQGVLFPVYWKSLESDLNLWLQALNYADCREADAHQLTAAVRRVLGSANA